MKKLPQQLFVLAFDHRSSFIHLLELDAKKLTASQTKLISAYKQIIYDGFTTALQHGLPKKNAALLVDPQFGRSILSDAQKNHYTVCLPVEKSGQRLLNFVGGKNFNTAIEKYRPDIIKVLIRYNPDDAPRDKRAQQQKLRQLADYCQKNFLPLMIEALVPPTAQQLQSVGGDPKKYDTRLRANLTVAMITEIQTAGIRPDIWKIEGYATTEEYRKVVAAITATGVKNAKLIILGRGEDVRGVKKWLAAGAKISGVHGFAIGRTIFWQPLMDFKNKKISRAQAVKKIADNYLLFYNHFCSSK